MANVTCKGCGAETNALAVFPGGICVKCYEQTPAARTPITAEDLIAMWGGRQRRR
jgi:hypothetical protein